MSAARNKTKRPLVAAFDLLCCLLLIFVLSQGHTTPPHIQTEGAYAVVITWPPGNDDDVDLYVRDPNNKIAYFAAQNVDQMTLERDDLGTATSGTTVLPSGQKIVTKFNGERTIIHTIIPGEYTVNVHMYMMWPGFSAPVPVTVQLWNLVQGRMVHEQKVVLYLTGQEITAFRFTLSASGRVSNINRLPAKFVGSLLS